MRGHKITPVDGDVAVGRNAEVGGDVDIQGKGKVRGTLRVEGFLDAPHIKGAQKGLFRSEEELNEAYPNPHAGWFAIVLDPADETKGFLYRAEKNAWVKSAETAHPYEFIVDSINVFASKGELEDERSRAENAEMQLRTDMETETTNRKDAIDDIKRKAALFGTFALRQEADRLKIIYSNLDNTEAGFYIPAANEEKAGVLTPEDKKRILENTTKIINVINALIDLQDDLKDGNINVGIAELAKSVEAGCINIYSLDETLKERVNVADVLTEGSPYRPLSARQGQILKGLIDGIIDDAPEELNSFKKIDEWIKGTYTKQMEELSLTAEERLRDETERAEKEEEEIRREAVLSGSIHISYSGNDVYLGYRNIDGAKAYTKVLPVATELSPGIMTAEDKRKLEDTKKYKDALEGAIEGGYEDIAYLVGMKPDGSFVKISPEVLWSDKTKYISQEEYDDLRMSNELNNNVEYNVLEDE